MDRSLEQQRAGCGKTLEKILKRPGLRKGRRIDQRIFRPERRTLEHGARQQAEMRHPPQGVAWKFVGQPHPRPCGIFVRCGQLNFQMMDEAFSHG